jgi:hypothetical protein
MTGFDINNAGLCSATEESASQLVNVDSLSLDVMKIHIEC